MRRSLFPILMVLCVVLYSCKDNVVCPAFQSTYILNDSMRMARYSLFLNDSTPKVAIDSRRTKYGVNKKSFKIRKNYDLMTAPKENELGPPKKDPLYYNDTQEEVFLASDFVDIDSLGADSVSAAPLFASIEEEDEVKYKYRYHPKNPYNQEQQYYNKYYGELFLDTRATEAELLLQQQLQHLDDEGDSTVVKEGRKWFWQRKKNKEEEPEESEMDQESLEEAINESDEAPLDDTFEQSTEEVIESEEEAQE